MSNDETGTLDDLGNGIDHEVRFVDAQARLPVMTLGLIVVMASLYFLAETLGGATSDSLVLLLLISGAKVNASILGGEWWRLIASAFLHGTFVHLVVNSVGVLLLGWFVENTLGRAFVLVCFVLASVAGALLSVYVTDYPSVGASGGMFGLLGATVGYALLRWRLIPRLIRTYVIGLPVAVGAASVVHGLMASNVDNSAHLGGGIAGLAAGLLVVLVTGKGIGLRAFAARVLVAGTVLVTVYSVGATVARMFFRFELAPVEWAVRGQGERRVHLWPVNWRAGTLVEGVCLLGDPVSGQAVRCYSDPYYSTLIVGPLQRMRGTGIYAEWLRRDGEHDELEGLYGPYDILWYEDAGRDLAFALLVYEPMVEKYIPVFTAFSAAPMPARGGPGVPGRPGRL